ncbi:MAG: hypothetical protein JXB32_01950 [Deltaproteobacteria bacterium]|nr:hypothetical protein [Deltaproteobacteria bacterium]
MSQTWYQPFLEFLRRWGWLLLALTAVLGFFTPFFLQWSLYGFGDWGYFHQLDAVARRTILDFGELPEWNPYSCGGNVLAANTQAHVWSPWLVFPLVFGPAEGEKVAVFLHAMISAAGMWALLGAMGLRGAGRFLGTVLWTCSGFFGHQVSGGHVWAWPFYYLPLVLLFFFKGCHELRWASLAGLFWGLMAMEGGVYPAPYTALLLGLAGVALACGWTPLEGRPRAAWWRPLAALGVAAVFFFLVAAIKLLPDLAHMAAHPRTVSDYDRIPAAMLLETLVGRSRDWAWDRPWFHNYRWWGEYGNYVGWGTLLLAGGALVFRFRRARVPLLLLSLGLTLALGHLGPGTPWDTLHRLPVFSNLRVPSRFTVFTALALAFLAGLAVSEGERWLRARFREGRVHRLVALLPALLAVAIAADVTIFNAHPMYRVWTELPPQPNRPPTAIKQVRGTYKRMYDHTARNRGTLVCQENNAIPRSPRVKQQDHEYGVIPPQDGTVRLVDWSPNEIRLDVDLKRDAIVWVNQNYHLGWRSNLGRVEALDHQLVVLVPKGRHRLDLRYRAPGLRAGMGLTATGLLLVAGWFVGDRWWRRRRVRRPPDTPPPGTGPPPGPTVEAADPSAGPSTEAPADEAPAAPLDTPTASTGRAAGAAARPTGPPPRWSRRWWLRVFAIDAAFVVAAVALPTYALLIAEPGDPVWTRQVHDHIRPRFRPGDVIHFNHAWTGETLRLFTGLEQTLPAVPPQLLEGGWRRLWYVHCMRDGDPRKLQDVLGRYEQRSRAEFGHYAVYLLEPPGAAGLFYLHDRLETARARRLPKQGAPSECTRRGDGPPLVCGPRPYHEVRRVREKLGGQRRQAVWVHPLGDDATLELTFPGVLTGVEPTFTFRYGLTDAAATARHGKPVEVVVRAGDVLLRRLEAANAAGWHAAELTVPEGAPPDLVITVRSDDAGARHFCIDAVLRTLDGGADGDDPDAAAVPAERSPAP